MLLDAMEAIGHDGEIVVRTRAMDTRIIIEIGDGGGGIGLTLVLIGWESGRVAIGTPLTFRTRSGALVVASRDGGYEMDFPALPVEPTAPPAHFAEILGSVPTWVGRNGMDLFAELEDERAVRSLRPDLVRLAEYPVRGVIVTARAARLNRTTLIGFQVSARGGRVRVTMRGDRVLLGGGSKSSSTDLGPSGSASVL